MLIDKRLYATEHVALKKMLNKMKKHFLRNQGNYVKGICRAERTIYRGNKWKTITVKMECIGRREFVEELGLITKDTTDVFKTTFVKATI